MIDFKRASDEVRVDDFSVKFRERSTNPFKPKEQKAQQQMMKRSHSSQSVGSSNQDENKLNGEGS